LSAVQNICNLYEARGFRISDNEFSSIRESILPIELVIVGKGQHIPEVERSIRTLKEDVRTTIHGLPILFYPQLMMKSLLIHVTRLRNMLPSPNSVCQHLSPATVVIGTHIQPSIHDVNAGDDVEDNDVNDNNENESQNNIGLESYNLRNNTKKTRDQSFNKQNYTFLMCYKKRTRALSKDKHEYVKRICNTMISVSRGEQYNAGMLHKNIVHYCMTQMSAKKGIKLFGEKALEAMVSEYSQLDKLSVFLPRWASSLSYEEKNAALNIIDLIKEKRSGKIKGRTVVDGRGQRESCNKIDTSSPALVTEGFMGTLVIDAEEGRDVVIADVAGCFLKAKQPDYALLRVTGSAVDAILRANKKK